MLQSYLWPLYDAENGSRNNVLNSTAYTIGYKMPQIGCTEEEAFKALYDAAIAIGLDSKEATSTINSGLKAGTNAVNEDKKLLLVNNEGKVVMTTWESKTKTIGYIETLSYEDLENMVSFPKYKKATTDKGDLPLFSLATYAGGLRGKSSLEAITGIVLDIDGGSFNYELLGDIYAVAHTTFSHTKESPHWRVIIPFTSTTTKKVYDTIANYFNGLYENADKCPVVQGYFVPCFYAGYEYVVIGDPSKVINPDEWLDKQSYEESKEKFKHMNIGSFLDQEISRLKNRHDGLEKPIPTPWSGLNAYTNGGIWPGLAILVSKPAFGKTQWALEYALYAANKGYPVVYISLELDRLQFVSRLLGLTMGSHWSKVYGGDYSNHSKIIEYSKRLPLDMFYYIEADAYTFDIKSVDSLCKYISTTKARKEGNVVRPFLVVLDYLQLLSHDDEGEQKSIKYNADGLRSLTRKYNCVAIAISAAARDKYAAMDGKGNAWTPAPGVSNPELFVGFGKGSGTIEYSADQVLVICGDPCNQWQQTEKLANIAIAKVRSGKPGWLPMIFDGNCYKEISKGESNED